MAEPGAAVTLQHLETAGPSVGRRRDLGGPGADQARADQRTGRELLESQAKAEKNDYALDMVAELEEVWEQGPDLDGSGEAAPSGVGVRGGPAGGPDHRGRGSWSLGEGQPRTPTTAFVASAIRASSEVASALPRSDRTAITIGLRPPDGHATATSLRVP